MNATLDHAAGVEAGRNAPTVRVWDPLVRLFHWSLAACILGAFLVEEGDTAHQWLGYTASARAMRASPTGSADRARWPVTCASGRPAPRADGSATTRPRR